MQRYSLLRIILKSWALMTETDVQRLAGKNDLNQPENHFPPPIAPIYYLKWTPVQGQDNAQCIPICSLAAILVPLP